MSTWTRTAKRRLALLASSRYSARIRRPKPGRASPRSSTPFSGGKRSATAPQAEAPAPSTDALTAAGTFVEPPTADDASLRATGHPAADAEGASDADEEIELGEDDLFDRQTEPDAESADAAEPELDLEAIESLEPEAAVQAPEEVHPHDAQAQAVPSSGEWTAHATPHDAAPLGADSLVEPGDEAFDGPPALPAEDAATEALAVESAAEAHAADAHRVATPHDAASDDQASHDPFDDLLAEEGLTEDAGAFEEGEFTTERVETETPPADSTALVTAPTPPAPAAPAASLADLAKTPAAALTGGLIGAAAAAAAAASVASPSTPKKVKGGKPPTAPAQPPAPGSKAAAAPKRTAATGKMPPRPGARRGPGDRPAPGVPNDPFSNPAASTIADVFGGTLPVFDDIPPTDPVFGQGSFGGSAQSVGTPSRPAGPAARKRPAAAGATSSATTTKPPGAKKKPAEAASRAGQPAASTPVAKASAARATPPGGGEAARAAAPTPEKGGRGGRRLLLIALILIVTIVACAIVYLMTAQQSGLKGLLHFSMAPSAVDPAKVAALTDRHARLLADPGFRAEARNALRGQAPELAPGLLGDTAADAARYASLVHNLAWDPLSRALVLHQASAETAAGDDRRLFAIVSTLYDRNRALAADAEHVRTELGLARARLDAAGDKVRELDAQLARDADVSAVRQQLAEQVARFKEAADAAGREHDLAAQRVRSLSDELKALAPINMPTTAPSASPDAQPADAVAAALTTPAPAPAPTTAPTAPDAGRLAIEGDEQIKQLTADLARLGEALRSAKDLRDSRAAEAKTLLDAAQQQFDSVVQAAERAAGGNDAMRNFVGSLKDLQDRIRSLNDELVQQQKEQRELLDALKSSLAQANAERLKQIWQNDGELAKATESLAIAEHRYNAAVGGRLPEAARLKKQVEQITSQISARQQLLANADLYNPVVKQVQDTIELSVRKMEQSRAKNEKLLQDVLKPFARITVADLDKLPEDQKSLAHRLEESSQNVSQARAGYTKKTTEANNESDALVLSLTQQVASQQARIDDRKRQLEAIAGKAGVPFPAAPNPPRDAAAIALTARDLAAAQDAESRAHAAYEEAVARLKPMEEKLRVALAAQASANQRPAAEAARVAAEKEVRELESAADAGTAFAVAGPPDLRTAIVRDPVGEDHRATYLPGIAMGGLLLGGLTLLMTRQPSARELPVAADAGADEEDAQAYASARAVLPGLVGGPEEGDADGYDDFDEPSLGAHDASRADRELVAAGSFAAVALEA